MAVRMRARGARWGRSAPAAERPGVEAHSHGPHPALFQLPSHRFRLLRPGSGQCFWPSTLEPGPCKTLPGESNKSGKPRGDPAAQCWASLGSRSLQPPPLAPTGPSACRWPSRSHRRSTRRSQPWARSCASRRAPRSGCGARAQPRLVRHTSTVVRPKPGLRPHVVLTAATPPHAPPRASQVFLACMAIVTSTTLFGSIYLCGGFPPSK